MDVSWLSLDVNILDDSKIKLIRKYPGGDQMFVLWIGIICLAMKADNAGYVELSPGIPYDAEDLAALFDIDIKTVKAGLSLFASDKFQMISIINGNTIEITNFIKHQKIDKILKNRENTRLRVQRHRAKSRRLLAENNDVTGYTPVTNEPVTQHNTIHNNTIHNNTKDKAGQCPGQNPPEIEKELETEKKKEIKKEAKIRHKHGEYSRVLLTDEQLQKLKTKYGDKDTNSAIKILDEYIETSGRKYKNHYLVLTKWPMDEVEKDKFAQSGQRKEI